jgi:hypothetical protein
MGAHLENVKNQVRFQVLTAASMKFRFVFWDVLPCKIIVDRRFRGTCYLHHQGDDSSSHLRKIINDVVQPRRELWYQHGNTAIVKSKKSCPATRHGGAWGERRYSSYSFTTSALDGGSGQHHASAALYPRGKDPRYPLERRLGGPQSRSGHRG